MDDLDARIARYGGAASAPSSDDLSDVDALLARYQQEAASPEPSVTVPPKDPEGLQKKIDAGMLPLPGGLETAKQAWGEAQRTAVNSLADQTLFGLPGRAMRAVGAAPAPAQPIPKMGKGDARRWDDFLPTEATLTGVPAAAIDTASIGGIIGRAGQTIGSVPAELARKLGASEAQTAVRPSIQAAADAAGGGATFGAIDAVARGNDPIEGAAVGSIGGALMSQLPAVASSVEGALSRQVLRNDLRSVKQMAKKGTLDKALAQFGNGDQEAGAREMLAFADREHLGPVFRAKGDSANKAMEARKQSVWKEDLEPIYRWAKAADPKAAVPMEQIAGRLRAQVRERGGNEAELIEKAIAKLTERNAGLRGRGGVPEEDMPLDVLLTNARDFQGAGHAGVVNYMDPPESKIAAREIGRTLRALANERVARIYEQNPKAAVALATGKPATSPTVTFRDEPAGKVRAGAGEKVRAADYPNVWARRYQEARDLAADVPARLAAGNKRYSDYAKLQPIVEQAGALKAGEKMHGLIDLIKRGRANMAGAAIGYALGGGPAGAVVGAGVTEAGRRIYPPALRGARAVADFASGVPVPAAMSKTPQMGGDIVPSGLPGALVAKETEDR
jgi:hypothetical protein